MARNDPASTAPTLEMAGDGVCRVSGALTFATVTTALAQSGALFRAGTGPLVLDLSGVDRVDSAGLALLVEWLRLAQATGRTLTYRHIPRQLLAIAGVSGIDGLLPAV